MSRRAAALAVLLAAVVGAAGCGGATAVDEAPATNFEELAQRPDTPAEPGALAEAVTGDAVWPHLEALQRIADEHDGNRAAGTSGYDASVDYVAGLLWARGFDVDTPSFTYEEFRVDTGVVRVGDRALEVEVMRYSPGTRNSGVTAEVVALPRERRGVVDDTPGCSSADYTGVDVTGKVVLVDRGACPFADKERVAAGQGAAALLVANNEDGLVPASLLSDQAPRIPGVLILQEDGEALRAAPGEVFVEVATTFQEHTSRNVVAQTRTGSARDVVVVGAHLDSVEEGAGVHDNGSGVGAVLETALVMGPEPDVVNAVRFAFWGAEELGLIGSYEYVNALPEEEALDVALYLNFDMIGSPNPGYFVYDGDDSDQVGAGPGPEGSSGIERVLAAYLEGRGVPVEGTDFDGRSDYGPFIEVGVPAGGLFTGAEDLMSQDQAEKWGGTAGEPFDPNYHTEKDTLDNVNREALDRNSSAVAHAVGVYAQSVTGPDGVPARDDRARVRNLGGS